LSWTKLRNKQQHSPKFSDLKDGYLKKIDPSWSTDNIVVAHDLLATEMKQESKQLTLLDMCRSTKLGIKPKSQATPLNTNVNQ
jgi:hypothetical protein